MDSTFEKLNLFFNFGLPLLLLVVTYFIGNMIERKHFRRLQEREEAMHGFPG